jgi:transcription initiation factor TFIID subunit 10
MDQELDPDLDMVIDPAPPEPENPDLEAPLPETREPTRKDISLREFLGKMDDYAPIVRSPLPFPPPALP